jgi:hypothetical protein
MKENKKEKFNLNNTYSLRILKHVAYKNVTKEIEDYEDFEKAIIKWYCNKYNITDIDSRVLDKTIESIIIEYYEDLFNNDPNELKAYKDGYDNVEEAEREMAKKDMGDEYHEELDYLETPPKNYKDIDEEFHTIGEQ